MGVYEVANQLAVLSATRQFSWTDDTPDPQLDALAAGSGLPASAAAGVDVGTAVKAAIAICVRDQIHRRSAFYTIPIHDAATTYGATIGGNAVTYVAGGDTRADQALRGLMAAINASVPIQAIATAIVVNAAGVDVSTTPYDDSTDATTLATAAVTIVVRGVTEADYAIDQSVAGGGGTIACVADALGCDFIVYASRKVLSGTSEWTEVTAAVTLDQFGWTDPDMLVNAYGRVYVRIFDIEGTGDGATITYAPTVLIGAGVLEGTS